jgi:hypothetical protein
MNKKKNSNYKDKDIRNSFNQKKNVTFNIPLGKRKNENKYKYNIIYLNFKLVLSMIIQN